MMEQRPTIGVATREADGTATLMLRAEGPGGILGDALFSCPITPGGEIDGFRLARPLREVGDTVFVLASPDTAAP